MWTKVNMMRGKGRSFPYLHHYYFQHLQHHHQLKPDQHHHCNHRWYAPHNQQQHTTSISSLNSNTNNISNLINSNNNTVNVFGRYVSEAFLLLVNDPNITITVFNCFSPFCPSDKNCQLKKSFRSTSERKTLPPLDLRSFLALNDNQDVIIWRRY